MEGLICGSLRILLRVERATVSFLKGGNAKKLLHS